MFNIDKYCGPKLIEVVYKYLEKRSMPRVHSSFLSNINSLFLRRNRGILLHSQISIHYFCTIVNSGKKLNWYPIRRLFSQNNSNIEILFLIVNFFLPILNIYTLSIIYAMLKRLQPNAFGLNGMKYYRNVYYSHLTRMFLLYFFKKK